MDKFVNVAEMLDYKRKMRNEEGHVFHSVVIKAQYNCPDNRVRIYTIELFEERMARGDVVNTQKVYGPWKAINPRSVEQELKNFSCTGKK
jgi:site-specific DNA-cytosine methylase